MTKIFTCPLCHQVLKKPPDYSGRNLRCPGCQAVIKLATGPQKAPKPHSVPPHLLSEEISTADQPEAYQQSSFQWSHPGVLILAVIMVLAVALPISILKYQHNRRELNRLDCTRKLQVAIDLAVSKATRFEFEGALATLESVRPTVCEKGFLGLDEKYRVEYERLVGQKSEREQKINDGWSTFEGKFVSLSEKNAILAVRARAQEQAESKKAEENRKQVEQERDRAEAVKQLAKTVKEKVEAAKKSAEASHNTLFTSDKHPEVPSKERQMLVPPKVLALDCGKGTKLELLLIPAGEFQMGSTEDFRDVFGKIDDACKPVHAVRFTNPFYLGKYEVTQRQWLAVMGSNPSEHKGNVNLPVENVSWEQCQEFCKKLSDRSGRVVRLPSEAEWEYACRAGSTSAYCFGDSRKDLKKYAWSNDNSNAKSHPVGKKRANAWGLYDMHGNVDEVCEDFFHDNYEGAPSDGSAWTRNWNSSPFLGYQPLAITRGGNMASLFFRPTELHSAARSVLPINYPGSPLIGFRVSSSIFAAESVAQRLGEGIQLPEYKMQQLAKISLDYDTLLSDDSIATQQLLLIDFHENASIQENELVEEMVNFSVRDLGKSSDVIESQFSRCKECKGSGKFPIADSRKPPNSISCTSCKGIGFRSPASIQDLLQLYYKSAILRPTPEAYGHLWYLHFALGEGRSGVRLSTRRFFSNLIKLQKAILANAHTYEEQVGAAFGKPGILYPVAFRAAPESIFWFENPDGGSPLVMICLRLESGKRIWSQSYELACALEILRKLPGDSLLFVGRIHCCNDFFFGEPLTGLPRHRFPEKPWPEFIPTSVYKPKTEGT